MSDTQDPRYPIGQYRPLKSITPDDRRSAVLTLAEFPGLLREAVRSLGTDQMNTPYREAGWTLRQVVHHVADSHMTAFHRIRRALTEDWPTVAGYDEKAFALLHDVVAPPEWSLELIESLHARWVMLLQELDATQWQRGYKHEERGPSTVEQAVLLYSWHSQHHLAHIKRLRKQQGW